MSSPTLDSQISDQPRVASIIPPKLKGYFVGDVIGEGSMGVVYAAKFGNSDFAIKLENPTPYGAESQRLRGRTTQQQAEDGGSLHNYQNAAIGIPMEDELGRPVVVMKRFERDITSDIKTKRSKAKILSKLIEIANGVGEILTYEGRPHGDVKPENIYVDKQGKWIVGDMGNVGPSIDSAVESASTELTLDHRAPKQRVQGGKGTAVDDVWSIAAIGYEMFTGRTPLKTSEYYPDDAKTNKHLLENQLKQLPWGVRGIFRKALSLDESERYADANEFKRELEYEQSYTNFKFKFACAAVGTALAVLGVIQVEKKIEQYKIKSDILNRFPVVRSQMIDPSIQYRDGETAMGSQMIDWYESRFKDVATARAFYLHPDSVTEAVHKSGGSFDYDVLRPHLLDINPFLVQKLEEPLIPPDGWVYHGGVEAWSQHCTIVINNSLNSVTKKLTPSGGYFGPIRSFKLNFPELDSPQSE